MKESGKFMSEETVILPDQVLERYKKELLLKAKWTHDSLIEGYKTWEESAGNLNVKAEAVIRNFVAGITMAMSIVRILNVAGARNKNYARQRVSAIQSKWPNLPDAPQGLKEIRNDLEHFEERLDTWAFTSSTHSIVDMNLGISAEGLSFFGVGETELLRNIDGNNVFLFWNHEVKLDEVMNWVIKLSEELKK